MASHNPKYKDLAQRIARSRTMAETVVSGGAGGARGNASTLILNEGTVEKPMLGHDRVETDAVKRYARGQEISSELRRGAELAG